MQKSVFTKAELHSVLVIPFLWLVWSFEQHPHPPAFLQVATVQKCMESALCISIHFVSKDFPGHKVRLTSLSFCGFSLFRIFKTVVSFPFFKLSATSQRQQLTTPAPLRALCLATSPSVCPYGLSTPSLDLTSILGNAFLPQTLLTDLRT